MTIHLPRGVENSIEAAVHGGHFATADEAVVAAWRVFEHGSITATGGAGISDVPADRDFYYGGGGGGGGTVQITGTYNIPPVVNLGLINVSGGAGSHSGSPGFVAITTLPEPTSLIPAMTSLLAALAYAWHRRRAA
jgi:hypothetical protein